VLCCQLLDLTVRNSLNTNQQKMLRTTFGRLGLRNLHRAIWTKTIVQRLPATPVMKLHDLHTKGDQELVTFLKDEIVAESKNLKSTAPKTVGDFQVTVNQAEVTLERKVNNETVSIRFNVNHTVDAEGEDEAPQRDKQEPEGEMRSRPSFDIEIKKDKQTLYFSCSFLRDQQSAETEEDYSDIFLIDEIALYEGELQDESYAVAGDILDGYLYDLFMNMLEDRGINNEFVEKLSDFATDYEHQLYVNLLKKLQDFIEQK